MQVRAVDSAAHAGETKGNPHDRSASQVVRPRPALHGPVHGRAGHRGGERGAPLHPGRSRVLAREPPVGDQRLRALLRRVPPARRACRRSSRTPAGVPRRHRRVHRGVAVVGPRVERGRADRRPRAPGPRRRDHLARRPLDPDHDVRRGQRAQHRARGLGRRRRLRRGRGRAARRHPHRPAELGVDLLRQRAGRRRRLHPRADAADREPRRDGAQLRPPRGGARDRRSRGARLRDHPGQRLRLGLDRDGRLLRRGARAPHRVRRLGGAHARPADAAARSSGCAR